MDSNKLINAVSNVNGNTFVGMTTVTTPTLLGGKKNAMQGRVKKHMIDANVMVFQNKNVNGYEAMVQRRLIAEGKDPASFELGPRAWGTRVEGLPIVEHKDKIYLEVIFLAPGKVFYTLDGTPIEKEAIEGLREVEPSEESQGGLSNKVVIRTFAAESVAELKINGEVVC
jgi:hypothetical protein